MISNLAKIRGEATSRVSNLVFYIKQTGLPRKQVRAEALEEAKTVVHQLSLLNEENKRLSELEERFLAQRVTLKAMRQSF